MFTAAGKSKTGVVPVYIEDVFSTWLYTGNGSTQTITNGIDLQTKGGLVWFKCRSSAFAHSLFDTARGTTVRLDTASSAAQAANGGTIAFNANGFTTPNNESTSSRLNETYASWTFAKQPKFFDVVTYTGNGANRTISHSLGSVPGCIMVKRTDTTGDWQVYHRSLANTEYLVLNLSDAKATGTDRWNSTTATSSVFSLGTNAAVNASGGTYVAYIFAHDAGGFGLSGTDNVISCGSFTTDGSGNATVTLGYEPQWTLIKRTDATVGGNWRINDSMRNMVAAPNLGDQLFPNLSSAESIGNGVAQPTATGFTTNNGALIASATYIYIAIRRGPMRVPTSGTSVFAPSARSGTGASGTSTALGSVTDLTIIKQRGSTQTWAWTDRLRGATQELTSAGTTAETAYANDVTGFDNMTGFAFGSGASGQVNTSASTYIDYLLRRAPGFFDEVCYTGTGVNGRAVDHNLQVAPELIITKSRGADGTYGGNWAVACSYVTSPDVNAFGNVGFLNLTDAFSSLTYYNVTNPTATQFTVRNQINFSGGTFVSYLFASCPGVSKVGSYTGNGTTQTINCGFTGGARFVLIKRTDSTGDWYVYDTARGIISGNDPYLLINSTAAEVTTTDYISVQSSGFGLTASAPAALNANGGSFIYLAIA